MQEVTKYREKCRIKKGDEVIVRSGKCRGETGKVDRVDRKAGRIYVSGLNLYKRHSKPNMSNQTGGIVEKAMPLPMSVLALVDPKSKKATRVGYKTEGDKKVRFAKKSGTLLS